MFQSLSIIIPTFNEEKTIQESLSINQSIFPTSQIIIVDGGSQDQTIEICKNKNIEILSSKKGRGIQMNAGALHAQRDLLLFLHADTHLSKNAPIAIQNAFEDDSCQVSTFQLKFDMEHWILKIYEFFAKFDSIFTTFGDQGIIVRKKFFNDLGSFPEWKIFEDVHFLRKARKITKIQKIPETITTSARKFRQKGLIHQQFKNAGLIFKYLRGTNHEDLAHAYGETPQE